MDITNFTEFIKESDNPSSEIHGWKRLIEEEEAAILA
jgi:hypothetical protein